MVVSVLVAVRAVGFAFRAYRPLLLFVAPWFPGGEAVEIVAVRRGLDGADFYPTLRERCGDGLGE